MQSEYSIRSFADGGLLGVGLVAKSKNISQMRMPILSSRWQLKNMVLICLLIIGIYGFTVLRGFEIRGQR